VKPHASPSSDTTWVRDAYAQHAPRVLRRARSILGNDEDARDALQEIFARLSERPDVFKGQSAVTTFLYAVTTHHCLNMLRNRNNRARLVNLHIDKDATAAPAAESVVAAREVLSRVGADLAEVAVYFFFDRMTYDEIAEVMSCSRRHVANQLDRFRAEAARLVR
jgi:RNA polymerase sigma factor (sigma-70 family)